MTRELNSNLSERASLVGMISDTHGKLRPEVLVALEGCGHIIHAGDLGKLEIFAHLSRIAPTVAVRGNVDRGSWAEAFPETLVWSIAGINFYVLHDLNALDFDPGGTPLHVVVSGHSHQPALEEKAGVLYVNPGSAGPRRFSLPVTLARLEIGPDEIRAELVDVLHGAPRTTLTIPRRRIFNAAPGPGA